MTRRVLMLAYYFPPYRSVGTVRPLKFAKYLPEFGWEPTVLAAPVLSSDPRDDVTEANVWESLRVVRVAPGLLRNKDEGMAWVRPALAAALRLHRSNAFDCCWITGGPFFPFLTGLLLLKFAGVPYVLDYRDGWTFFNNNQPVGFFGNLVDRFARLVEQVVVRAAAKVVVVAPGVQAEFRRRYPDCDQEKFVLIPNGFDQDDLVSAGSAERTPGAWRVVCTGNLYSLQFVIPFLKALRRLLDENPPNCERIEVLLVGHPVAGLVEAVQQLRLQSHVSVVDAVPRVDALKYQKSADLLLNVNPHPWTVSAKLFEYLALGKPVLSLELPNSQDFVLLGHDECISEADVRDETEILTHLTEQMRLWQAGVAQGFAPRFMAPYERRQLTAALAATLEAAAETRHGRASV